MGGQYLIDTNSAIDYLGNKLPANGADLTGTPAKTKSIKLKAI